MADYNSDRTGSNIDLTLDKVDALDAKVQPTATGANVTGTLTTDGLTVDGDSTPLFSNGVDGGIGVSLELRNTLNTSALGNGNKIKFIGGNNDSRNAYIRSEAEGSYGRNQAMTFGSQSGGAEVDHVKISDNGDVQFYEDTGTTAKFVWDASTESLGIGGSSSGTLTVDGSTKPYANTGLVIKRTGVLAGSADFRLSGVSGSEALSVNVNNLERMRIDSSGNVGIGTGSPDNKLTVASGSDSTGVGDGVAFYGGSSNKQAAIESYNTGGYSGDLRFYTGNKSSASTTVAESARIDSSGNLLVGQTSATAGYKLQVTGLTQISGTNTTIRMGQLDSTYSYIQGTRDGANGDIKIFGGLHPQDGVYLGGTGAANKLDDYEEGTWTPSVIGASSTGTATYSARVGTYTKVGNLCYVQAYVSFSSFTGTGEMLVLGLPFAGETGGYETHCGSLIIDSVPLPSGTVNLASRAQNDEAYIRLVSTRDNAHTAAVQCDASGVIQIGVSYRTA